MNIIITGNLEITDAMKNYISAKLVELAKYADNVESASVILTLDKKRHSAVIIIGADGAIFTDRKATGDMYSSVDSVLAKIESKLRKHQEKHNSKTRKAFKKILKELNAEAKQEKCSKGNRNFVNAIFVALETCLNFSEMSFGF